MKILNLFAGVGGNRILWGDEHEITAIELNPEIAKEYQRLYPNDTVICVDAHKYLLDHVLEGWDFIWSSPPCPSHSRINRDGNHPPRYPDMDLYAEIFMLQNWFKRCWVVENVIPYYKPLVTPAIEIGRHYFWCNFPVNKLTVEPETPIKHQKGSGSRYGFNFDDSPLKGDKRQILRNLVNPEIGLHFLNQAQNIQTQDTKQLSLL